MKETATLLYIDEHLGCPNYIKENNIGFRVRYLEKNKNYTISLDKEFVVLFVTKGKIVITSKDKSTITVSRNEFCLLSNFSDYSVAMKGDSIVTCMYFDRPNSRCDFLNLDRMTPLGEKNDKLKMRKMKMNLPLLNFITNLDFYLENKMFCRHLHDIKESEFFFIIRGFYTKEETAFFFSPVIRALNDFTNLVHANYLKAETVAELAQLCNMTTKTFTRRFKSVFDETPKQWMLREKANLPSKRVLKKTKSLIYMGN